MSIEYSNYVPISHITQPDPDMQNLYLIALATNNGCLLNESLFLRRRSTAVVLLWHFYSIRLILSLMELMDTFCNNLGECKIEK